MADKVILTFDLGTTRLKVAAFDLAGRLVDQVTRRNEEHQSGDFYWQDANQWWQDAVSGTRQLLATNQLRATDVVGISLSGRAGAAVFVDRQGNVIQAPWSDNRHIDILTNITEDAQKRSAQYGPTLLAKYLWLQQHAPETAARVNHMLYAKDFLLFRLTNLAVTDPSSGPDGAWDTALLRRCAVDAALLPGVALPWEVAGELTSHAADLLGLKPGTPVAAGAHDGVSANIGAGAIGRQQFALTLGTHAVIRTVTDVCPEGARRFYGFPPDRHVIGGNALFAGRALDWFLDNWFDEQEADRQALFRQLNDAVCQVPPGSEGVFFLPFLRGRIAPRNRPGARASFHGLHLGSGRVAMYRAVLEGAAFALRDILDQLVDWTGSPVFTGVTGSGALSAVWVEILANVLEQPLTLTDGASEGRGAAICCAAAMGLYSSIEAATVDMVRPSAVVEPSAALVGTYAGLRHHWLATVSATKGA